MILVDVWQSFGYDTGHGWGIQTGTSTPGVLMQELWKKLPDRILTASPHLQGGGIPWDVVQELRDQGMGLVEALDLLGL